MLLAHLGAEVIKIENPKGPDGARFFLTITRKDVKPVDYRIGNQLYDTSNFGKLGVSIDVSTPEGREIVLKLVEKSDILIENMAVGVMKKHGLAYEDVIERNPSIVYVSSTACGQTGPEKNFIGYAATFANKSGLGHVTGYPGSIPSTFVGSIDLRSAVMAACAALTALYHRDVTGEGQYVDVASQEAIASHLGDVYLDYIANGVIQGPQANRRPGYAPQSAYKTLGDDEWVAVSVGAEDEWRALCGAMGRPELADDPRFADHESRARNWEQLDDIVTAWTSNQDKYAVVNALQAVKVPAGPFLNSKGLFEDPHIRERRSVLPMEHPAMGYDYAVNAPWRYGETPAEPGRRSPLLGEHTVQVLKNVLGMKDPEIDGLAEKKIIRRLYD